jgi:hypothetical protein
MRKKGIFKKQKSPGNTDIRLDRDFENVKFQEPWGLKSLYKVQIRQI